MRSYDKHGHRAQIILFVNVLDIRKHGHYFGIINKSNLCFQQKYMQHNTNSNTQIYISEIMSDGNNILIAITVLIRLFLRLFHRCCRFGFVRRFFLRQYFRSICIRLTALAGCWAFGEVREKSFSWLGRGLFGAHFSSQHLPRFSNADWILSIDDNLKVL